MSIVFTLKCNGVERTLADWGIEKPQLNLVSRAADVLTFNVVTDFEAEGFAYRTPVELYRVDGALRRRVFMGLITSIPRMAGDSAESLSYTATGLGWYLENKVYQEFWAGVGAYKSRIQLTYGDDGDKMSSADTLTKILNYAIGAGAPFAVGDVSSIAGNIPSEEAGDRTCAEAIELVLRWYPDAVTWWDYSATPPTFNISTAATAPIVDFSEDGESITDIRYERRDSIRVPGVAVKYEWIDSIDGESVEVVTTDAAGDANAFGAMVVTVSLRGGSVSTMRQRLVSEAISLDSKTWWRKNVPQLKEVPDDLIVIEEILRDERTDADGNPIALPRKVVEGAHADWMPGNTGRVQIVARIRWYEGKTERTTNFTVSGTGTSLGTKTYSKVSSAEEREPMPTGMAARLFAALDRPHWEGSIGVTEAECSHWDLPGKSVRLLDRSGLTALCGPAQVQAVSMDIAQGVTTINFGPSPTLSAGDLVDLLRANRNRRDGGAKMKMRSGGGVGIVDGSKTTPNDSVSTTDSLKHTLTKGEGEAVQKIAIDFATLPTIPAHVKDLSVQLRPGIIVVNGEIKRVLAPLSESYDQTPPTS